MPRIGPIRKDWNEVQEKWEKREREKVEGRVEREREVILLFSPWAIVHASYTFLV